MKRWKVIFLSAIIVLSPVPNVSADVLPVIEVSSSLTIDKGVNVSLKVVDVVIFLGNEYATGYGNFTLSNNDNATKSFVLGFDPGGTISGATVLIDNVSVPLRHGYMSNSSYPIVIFNSTIGPLDRQFISLSWKFPTQYSWHHDIWNPMIVWEKRWRAYYNIIGTKAWREGIENVKVRFVSECEEFNGALSSITPTERFIDEKGRDTIVFEYSNFSQPELMIQIEGKTDVIWNPLIYICCPAVLIIMFFFTIYLRSRKRQR